MIKKQLVDGAVPLNASKFKFQFHSFLPPLLQVSAMMKKHLVEGVVPVIIELKRSMEAARHPLLGDLMAATAAMLRDYKNEVRAAAWGGCGQWLQSGRWQGW